MPIYSWVVAVLYAWVRRHPRLVDGVLAAALLLTGIGPIVAKGNLLFVPVALGLAVPVVFRRANPIGSYATAVVAGGSRWRWASALSPRIWPS